MGAFLLPVILVGLTGCAATKNIETKSAGAESAQVVPQKSRDGLEGKEQSSAVCSDAARCGVVTNTLGASNPQAAISVAPNQCWVQAVVRPKPVQQSLDLVVRDAVNKLQVTPALISEARAQLVVKPGTTTYKVLPPVYRAVIERVEVKPEVVRSVVVPAVFETVQENVVVEASRIELEACKSAGAVRFSAAPVSALCTKYIPEKRKTVYKNQLVTPETTKTVVEPAEYKEVTRWVLETPARTVPVDIPDETTSLKVKAIAQAEQIEEKMLPEQRRQIGATHYVGEPKLVTVPAVCDVDIRESMVLSLQYALKREGFDPGVIDGKLGKRTVEALLEYQLNNGLAYGALTYESVSALGLR